MATLSNQSTVFLKSKPAVILLALWLLICSALPVLTREKFHIDEQVLQQAEEQYGPSARRRLLAWEKLIGNTADTTELETLEKVNSFFNRIPFIEDALHWKQKDYWATPIEFLASDGGDCEDFSLAKYFTLKALGISDDKLALTYVKALKLNQAHMVLTYYPTPNAEPLVLDNLTPEIKPASKRQDLMPVYSFNGSNLWLAKQRGRGQRVGRTEQISRWRDLMRRMPEGMK